MEITGIYERTLIKKNYRGVSEVLLSYIVIIENRIELQFSADCLMRFGDAPPPPGHYSLVDIGSIEKGEEQELLSALIDKVGRVAAKYNDSFLISLSEIEVNENLEVRYIQEQLVSIAARFTSADFSKLVYKAAPNSNVLVLLDSPETLSSLFLDKVEYTLK